MVDVVDAVVVTFHLADESVEHRTVQLLPLALAYGDENRSKGRVV